MDLTYEQMEIILYVCLYILGFIVMGVYVYFRAKGEKKEYEEYIRRVAEWEKEHPNEEWPYEKCIYDYNSGVIL